MLYVLDFFDFSDTRVQTIQSVDPNLHIFRRHFKFELLTIKTKIDIDFERCVKLGIRFFLEASKDGLRSAYLGMDVSACEFVH